MPDFEHIVYLQHGSAIQQRVFNLIQHKKILYHLKSIQPVIAGTIPLNLYIPGKSDVDILGYHDDLSGVEKILLKHFSRHTNFDVNIKPLRGEPSLISRFGIEGIPIEVFVQNIPVARQYGYRHLLVEHWLLQVHGEQLRQRILDHKQSGIKTEPAFALALDLPGDPYEALLEFENDARFQEFLRTRSTP